MRVVVIAVVVILLAIVLLRLLRPSRHERPQGAGKIVKKPSKPGTVTPVGAGYHRSVSITCGPEACKAVQLLAGKRFLVGEIDKLPLADCMAANCGCKFIHHDDRREGGSDKRAISGLSTELYHNSGKPERRHKKGRRKTDLE